MCDDPDCDVDDRPPLGENWCPRRLDIEMIRWWSGHPMSCGQPQEVTLDWRPRP